MVMIYIWLGLFILTLAIEIAVPALVSIWFSAGSLVALILAAIFGDNLIWLQILAFVIVSIAAILALRPLIFNNKKTNYQTNVDSIVGKIGSVQTEVPRYGQGTVKLAGLVWSAELENETDEPIEKDTLVKVVKVDGNKLIITKYTEEK